MVLNDCMNVETIAKASSCTPSMAPCHHRKCDRGVKLDGPACSRLQSLLNPILELISASIYAKGCLLRS